MKIIFDIECDSLNATKIHCFSYCNTGNATLHSLTNYEDIISLLEKCDTLIGHNIVKFDIPVLEKLLNIKIKAQLIDTLGISWYLNPLQLKHGLEEWGNILGIEKPKIDNWETLGIEKYIYRCEQDVRITEKLFHYQMNYLTDLYENENNINRLLNYISFKLDCAREQEEEKILLDYNLCNSTLQKFKILQEEKITTLTSIMPDNITYKEISKPSKILKKDGSLSEMGRKWFALLKQRNLPIDYNQPLSIEVKVEKGNPTSIKQIKDYLFSIGWIPTTFKYSKLKNGDLNKVPQISVDGEICESIKKLYTIKPELQNLESLTMINHRIGILEGFLKNVSPVGYITARIKGFTNTFRFKHTEIVNLPSIDKPFCKEIRACLTCEKNELLCGSDLKGLESNTKMHYMYFFDPEYVKEMQVPRFCEHLDIAVLSGMLTPQQADEHKNKIRDFSAIRKKAKIVNFSAVYGVGANKLHLTSGMPLKECKKLLETYWKRNWSVKRISENIITKTVNKQAWLYNPVSKFWYTLRSEKDKFSTLNQGTGVFVFDSWVKEVRKYNIKICLQYHDEILTKLQDTPEEKEKTKIKLRNAINKVNENLKLNVNFDISIDFGKSYADCH